MSVLTANVLSQYGQGKARPSNFISEFEILSPSLCMTMFCGENGRGFDCLVL